MCYHRLINFTCLPVIITFVISTMTMLPASALCQGVNEHVGTVEMPFDGTMSAAIFDSDGNHVRTLMQAIPTKAGEKRHLFWDWHDEDMQQVIRNEAYEWRALICAITNVDEGAVGDSGNPPYGNTESNGNVNSIAYDSNDNLYTTS